MAMKCICYSATHRATGKKYIGMTCKSLDERKAEHFEEANIIRRAMKDGYLDQVGFSKKALRSLNYRVFNSHLVLLALTYEQNFDWAVEGVGTEWEMMELERELIEKFKTCSIYRGFNMLPMDDRLARLKFGTNYHSYKKNIVDWLPLEHNHWDYWRYRG